MTAPFRRTYPEFHIGYGTTPEDAISVAQSKMTKRRKERLVSFAVSVAYGPRSEGALLWTAVVSVVIEARDLEE